MRKINDVYRTNKLNYNLDYIIRACNMRDAWRGVVELVRMETLLVLQVLHQAELNEMR